VGPLPYQGPVTSLIPLFADGRRRVLAFDSPGEFRTLDVDASDLIRWIEAKEPRAIGNWRDLGPDEYARAFTAAQTAGLNVIDDLYFAFADVMAAGGTEADFAALVIPTLREKGWLKGADDGAIARRVELIYDTNLRMARGAGQWDRIQRGKLGLPYLRAATARDGRVRHPPKSKHSDHRAWDGIILPVDHPFWRRWWVPLGFRCRCTIIPMTRSQLARYPRGITDAAELESREARLGTPIFASPGAGVTQQVAQAIQYENNRPDRMPGLPLLDLGQTRADANRVWQAGAGVAAIDAIISALFG
jgi:uncharacterized protein with gpF-like domain